MNAKELFEKPGGEKHRKRFEHAKGMAIEQGHTVTPVEEWDEWHPGVFRGYCMKCGDNVTVNIDVQPPKDVGGFALLPAHCKGLPHERARLND